MDEERHVDPRYEFYAPQYYDFTTPSDDEGEVDSWFGTDTVSGLCSPVGKGERDHGAEECDASDSGVGDDGDAAEEASGEAGSERPTPRSGVEASGQSDAGPFGDGPKTRAMAREAMTEDKPKPRCKAASRMRATSFNESCADNSEMQGKRNHGEMKSTDGRVKAWEAKITVPISPKFHALKKRTEATLTTEEREYTQAQQEAQQEAKRRRLAGEKVKRILGGVAALPPPRSTAQLTMPKEFKLRAAARLRKHRMTTRSMTPEGKGRRPAREKSRRNSTGRHVPLAEAVNKFHLKTPTRFHTRSRLANKPDVHASPPRGLTEPHSPCLRAGRRPQTHEVKSTEAREIEELKKHPKFKARPVDARVMDSCGDYGVPRVSKRGVTVPVDVPLATTARGGIARGAEVAGPAGDDMLAESHRFRAGELDRRILEGPTFVPHRGDAGAITVPHSPALATRSRAGAWAATHPAAKEEPTPPPKFHARPLPAEAGPLCYRAPKAPVEPAPFHLSTDARGEVYRADLKRQLAREEEEMAAKRRKHARPLPASHDHPAALPAPAARAPTKQEPFRMPGESISEYNKAVTAGEARAKEEEARRARVFHARASKAVHAPAFVPKKATAPLTEVQNVHLRSNSRSSQRAKFEEGLKAKEAAEAEARRRAEEEAAAREATEVAAMRKAMVPKARGVPNFSKVFQPQLSNKSLTQPRAPALSTASRRANAAKMMR